MPPTEHVRSWWRVHGGSVLWVAAALTAAAAVWRLNNELPRLILDPDGAHDLRLRHNEVFRWFAGLEVYGERERGDYPPASYVLLWPLLGWLPLEAARWLWAVSSLAAMSWLAWIAVRHSRVQRTPAVLLMLLLPFATYAASATLSIGQIGNHVLPLMVAGPLLLATRPASLGVDVRSAGLLLLALVKPTLSAPFVWLVATDTWRLRPVALLAVAYMAVTAFAISLQPEPLHVSLFGWMAEQPQVLRGHGNVHKLLGLVGLRSLALPVSLLVFVTLGAWLARHRRAEIWIRLGVCALVAQLWMHHRMYDHMLMIVPMIALARIAQAGPRGDAGDVRAGILFALCWLTLLAPASFLALESPVAWLMELFQVAVWLGILVFLVMRADGSHPLAAPPEHRGEGPSWRRADGAALPG